MNRRNNIFRDPSELARILSQEKKRGLRIVFTNGCFDILHKGHVFYLKKARALGDRLVVGLNTDLSVKKIKGHARPINREGDRAGVLAGLKSVDYVCLFDEETPAKIIRILKPHVLVKGGDYKKEAIAGSKDVKKWGGKIVVLPYLKGYSTTILVDRIARLLEKNLHNKHEEHSLPYE